MEPKSGGPAFPRAGYDSKYPSTVAVPQDGMTLRDYFAAAALIGVLAKGYNEPPAPTAEAVYEYADAMLKARQ